MDYVGLLEYGFMNFFFSSTIEKRKESSRLTASMGSGTLA